MASPDETDRDQRAAEPGEPTPEPASTPPQPKVDDSRAANEASGVAPEYWLGARLQGLLIPQFVFEWFGDGGTNLFVPGGAATFTLTTSGPELVFALNYASYGMGETSYKPKDTPNTEYEILESTLMSLGASVDVMWSFPLDDDATLAFRLGGSAGFGWTFVGDLFRTQAYPANGDASDPDSYVKCDGPNDPAGSFRHCNQLDKDADHYDGFAEPSWFAGGSRPLIYPWVALPVVGLRYQPAAKLALDLETGISISGFVATLGFRYGL